MGLEAATYISELNTSNPVGATDPKSQGDNHIRLIKSTLQSTFPGASRAIYLETARADVADSATPDLGAAATNYVNLLGTTTITSFGTEVAGVWRFIRFNAARTLTHNATSLILPGAANITTAANDTALAVSEGSGNWRVLIYIKADGSAISSGSVTMASLTDGDAWTAEETVTSASADILGAASDWVVVTGTTTITSFGTGANRIRFVRFSGVLTLTHNATSLILPTGANITTQAGDTCIVISDGSSNARVYAYQRADGTPLDEAGLLAASQAEMETGTSVLVASTPGRQHFHPGHPKCWAHTTVSGGTPTLAASYNITSITDTGTGQLTVTIATDFSSVNWACLATVERSSTSSTTGTMRQVTIRNSTLAAGTVQLECYSEADDSGAGGEQPALVDPASWHMLGLGDHA